MGLFKKNKDSELIDEIKNLTSPTPTQNDFLTQQPNNSIPSQGPLTQSEQNMPSQDNFDMDVNPQMRSNQMNDPLMQENQQISQNPLPLQDLGDLQIPTPTEETSQPQQKKNLPEFENTNTSNDLIVPTPPPDLMQPRTPNLDMNHLMDVEEEFLRNRVNPLEDLKIERKNIDPKKPIFIKIENYEVTLQNIIDVKASAGEFPNIMFRMGNLNDSETTKLSQLHGLIEDMQRKIIFIDNLIFEKDN